WILSIWFIEKSIVQLGTNVFLSFRDILGNRSTSLVRILVLFFTVFGISLVTDVKLIHAAFAYLLSGFVTLIWILIRFRKHRTILSKGKTLFTKSLTKKLFLFGLPLILASFSGRITSYVDTLTITWFRTQEEVGLYQVALPATRILKMLGTSLTFPLLPMISELWAKKDKDRIRSTLYMLMKFSFFLTIPVLLGFLTFPDVVVRVLFGSEYLAATLAIRIMSVTMLLKVVSGVFAKTLVGIGKNVLRAKIYATAAAINLFGDILLVPIWGVEGAAVAFLTAILISFFLELYFTRKIVKFHAPFRSVLKMILGGVLTLGLIFLMNFVIRLPLWPKISMISVLGGTFYMMWVLRTGVMKNKDFEMLEKAIPIPIPDIVKDILEKLVK
ncbi:hypothetical protein AKJ51_04340, partial [candidate division MSBL1 archaeon SCGC-AAA382A20]